MQSKEGTEGVNTQHPAPTTTLIDTRTLTIPLSATKQESKIQDQDQTKTKKEQTEWSDDDGKHTNEQTNKQAQTEDKDGVSKEE